MLLLCDAARHSVTGSPAIDSDGQPCMRCACCLTPHSTLAPLFWVAAVLCAKDAVQGGDPEAPAADRMTVHPARLPVVYVKTFLLSNSCTALVLSCWQDVSPTCAMPHWGSIHDMGPSTGWVLQMCVWDHLWVILPAAARSGCTFVLGAPSLVWLQLLQTHTPHVGAVSACTIINLHTKGFCSITLTSLSQFQSHCRQHLNFVNGLHTPQPSLFCWCGTACQLHTTA